MEVLCQIASGENPLPSPLTCCTPDTEASPGQPTLSTTPSVVEHTPSAEETTDAAVPIPPQPPSLVSIGLKYLFDCYARVAVEERNYPKVSFSYR